MQLRASAPRPVLSPPLRFLLFAGLLGSTLPAPAQDVVLKRDASSATLIELYSSEGCSSCPPAETWLGRLKDSPRLWQQVFPVEFHVDYWDDLGWPDRFARPAYTARQRDYAARLQQDSVYTPEFVVDGQEWRGWFHGGDLPLAQATGGTLTLTIRAQGGAFSADFVPAPNAPSDSYTVHVAFLGMGIVSDVQRGENAGRELRHDFVVLDFQSQRLTAAPGAHFQSGLIPPAGTGPDQPGAVVAWVSSPGREVVQVVGGWLR
jgi:hypothetical protein